MLFRILLLGGVGYLGVRLIKSALAQKPQISDSQSASLGADDLVEDPHCHAYVPMKSAHARRIKRKQHFFCSEACADAFSKAS